MPTSRWSEQPAGSSWTVRRTVDHLADAMWLYAACIGRRATSRVSPPRNGDAHAETRQLIDACVSGALVVMRLLAQVEDDERIFHPSGLADRSGWIGMACTELLVHTLDATGDQSPLPDRLVDLANRVTDRVLPWTPAAGSGVARLMWATGRRPLDGLPPQPADWWWHSAPLTEWDGDAHRRSAPPQWP